MISLCIAQYFSGTNVGLKYFADHEHVRFFGFNFFFVEMGCIFYYIIYTIVHE